MNKKEDPDDWDRSNWSFPTLNGLCNDLCSIGVEAMIVTEEGLNELNELAIDPKKQFIGVSFKDKRFGIVEIKRSPIKWIRLHHTDIGWFDGTDLGDYYGMDYIVPDSRRLPGVHAHPRYIQKHATLQWGPIIDMKWSFEAFADIKLYPEKGNKLSKSHLIELEQYLNNDKELKTTILSSKSFIVKFFSAFSPLAFRGWTICTQAESYFTSPSIEEWSCYERIATLLLKAPVPT